MKPPLLISREAIVASQNRHLGRSIYTGMYPSIVTDSLVGTIKVPTYTIKMSEYILAKASTHTTVGTPQTVSAFSSSIELKIHRYLLATKASTNVKVATAQTVAGLTSTIERKIHRTLFAAKASTHAKVITTQTVSNFVSNMEFMGIYSSADDHLTGTITVPTLTS